MGKRQPEKKRENRETYQGGGERPKEKKKTPLEGEKKNRTEKEEQSPISKPSPKESSLTEWEKENVFLEGAYGTFHHGQKAEETKTDG